MAALTATQLAACDSYQDSINDLQAAVASDHAVLAAVVEQLGLLGGAVLGSTSVTKLNHDLGAALRASALKLAASAITVEAGVVKNTSLQEET